MDNLNLDIDTYSLEDLSKLFNLKDEYNEIDIDNEKQTLLLQLRDIGDIGVEKKRNITFFIDCAAGRLITLANDNKTDENQGTWSQLKNDTIQEGSHTIIENPNIKAGQVLLLTTLALAIAFVYFQFQGFDGIIDKGYYFTGPESSITTSYLYVLVLLHLVARI